MPTPASTRLLFALFGLAALAVGCGKEPAPAPSAGAPPAAAVVAGSGTTAKPEPTSRFALAADPKGPELSVLAAKAGAARPGVVVVGRVREMTKGFAAFTLTDVALKYCGEVKEGETSDDNCPNPWDYCCHKSEEIADHTIAVSVKEKGEVVALAAIPELRNLDTVAILGDLVKGPDGTLALEAKGWYRRARANLPASVQFPQ